MPRLAEYHGCVWQWHSAKHVNKMGKLISFCQSWFFGDNYVPFTFETTKKQSPDSSYVVLTVPEEIKHVKNLGQLISFSQIWFFGNRLLLIFRQQKCNCQTVLRLFWQCQKTLNTSKLTYYIVLHKITYWLILCLKR